MNPRAPVRNDKTLYDSTGGVVDAQTGLPQWLRPRREPDSQNEGHSRQTWARSRAFDFHYARARGRSSRLSLRQSGGHDEFSPGYLRRARLGRGSRSDPGGYGTTHRRVLGQSLETVWKSGRNSARAFPLLSYRVFYRSDGNDYDPVIVSVTVTLEGKIARVAGDISGMSPGAFTSTRDVTSRFRRTRRTSRRPPLLSLAAWPPMHRLSLTPSATETSRSMN